MIHPFLQSCFFYKRVISKQELLTDFVFCLAMANQVHCAHILVKTEAEAKAVLERIKKGEKFTSIATAVSLCPSGKKGGESAKFIWAVILKDAEQASSARMKGEISAV